MDLCISMMSVIIAHFYFLYYLLGPSFLWVRLKVYVFYLFKELLLSFIDLSKFVFYSHLFLLWTVSFPYLLLTLGFSAFLFPLVVRLECLFEFFPCFLKRLCITVDFPLRTSFAACHRFWSFFFHFSPGIFDFLFVLFSLLLIFK